MTNHLGASQLKENVASVEYIASSQILECPPGISLVEAAKRMHQGKCSSIIVTDDGKPLGIWTERDALSIDFSKPECLDIAISDVMSSPVKTVPTGTPLSEIGVRFREEGTRHFLVVDVDGEALGVITQTDVVISHGVDHFLYMSEVGSLMARSLVMIPGDMDLSTAVKKMRDSKVNALVVTALGDEGDGIITERDIVGLIAQSKTSLQAWEVASRPLISIPHNTPVMAARDLLIKRNIRHVGITANDGGLMGILSFSDILRGIQHVYIHQLEEELEGRVKELRESENRFRLLYEQAPLGYQSLDEDGCFIEVNQAWLDMFGYSRDEVIGHSFEDFFVEKGLLKEAFPRFKEAGEVLIPGYEILCRDGAAKVVAINGRIGYDEKGDFLQTHCILSDITESKRAEEKIKHMANHDVLTDLPNRTLLMDRLNQEIARSHRNKTMVAVMFLDLDDFKPVNDTMGHKIGDQILKQMSDRLVSCMRETDTVARFGGDEFVVVMTDIKNKRAVSMMAQKINKELSKPFALGSKEASLGASIGIALYPVNGQVPDVLLSLADEAMYKVKKKGKKDFFYATTTG